MAKFYVCSGDFQFMIDRHDPDSAALDALRTLVAKPVRRLSHITVVSEHGFPGQINEDDTIYTTLELLEEIGLLDQFRPEDWI